MGDQHYLDTPIWKDILAGIDRFRAISNVTVGNGTSTAFWFDLWLGNSTLHDRFPILFSHSARLNLNVATALSHGIRHFLVPRLSAAAASELRDLSMELHSVHLNIGNPDIRVCRLTNKKLSNKNLYASTFSHLQVDDVATKIWRSAAPLKCKIFCWLARKKRLPTNERRFRHHLNGSDTCLACPLDEDTDHLLLLCPRAKQVWRHFHQDFDNIPSHLRRLLALALPHL
jgi:hypothetical protein